MRNGSSNLQLGCGRSWDAVEYNGCGSSLKEMVNFKVDYGLGIVPLGLEGFGAPFIFKYLLLSGISSKGAESNNKKEVTM